MLTFAARQRMYVRRRQRRLAASGEEASAPARPCQRRPGLKGQPAVIRPLSEHLVLRLGGLG